MKLMEALIDIEIAATLLKQGVSQLISTAVSVFITHQII